MTMGTSKGSRSMWKLDLLEARFNESVPRFPHTKKLLTARHNEKLLRKLPTSKEDAEHEIRALKSDFFAMKFHGSYKKLEKEVRKVYKSDKSKFDKDDSKSAIIQFFDSEANVTLLISSKLVKSVINSILTTKALKETPFDFIPEEIVVSITDKESDKNPTHFFKTFCQDNKVLNNYISSLWNSKAVKQTLEEIEWSFKLVRGDLTKEEKAKRKSTGKNIEEDEGEGGIEDEQEEDDDDDDDSSDDAEDGDEEADGDLDLEEAYDKFAIYDKLVGDSDVEDNDEEERFDLDPAVNYTEITDEEASEQSASEIDDSDSESEETEPKSKASKSYDLPALASGYFSGGSDDEDEDDEDVDNDKVVKALTTQRKNRRGQRARQKIWAQKFGKEAKHVKSQQAILASEREIRQAEYEERKRKREAKAALASAPSGANIAPLGERKSRSSTPVPAPVEIKEQKMHPSWEAKKLAEEKIKNVKFTGKKITFD